MHLGKTQLRDRDLWYDGDISVSNKDVISFIQRGINPTVLFVDELTDEIKKYNRSAFLKKIDIKQEERELDIDWTIPMEYQTMDIEKYVIEKYHEECIRNDWLDTSDELLKRSQRVSKELSLFKKMNLLPILRVLIYIINTFQTNNIVWGVGRGSSVSSYVLYLMGVHDVDSVYFNINIEDFLRTDSIELK